MFFTRKRLRLYLVALLLVQITSCIALIPYIRDGFIDFRTYYTAGWMIRSGHAASLYDLHIEKHFQDVLVSPQLAPLPMLPPPLAALPFVPLSWLRFWPAYLVFFFINLCVLCLSAELVRPHLPAFATRWRPAPLLLVLSFFPAALALMMGQLSILLLPLYCLCFIALKRQHRFLAGALLALALFKFQVAAPIALLFLLWRQWAFVAGFCSAGTVLATLAVSLVGSQAFLAYLHSLYTLTSSVTADRASQVSIGIVPRMMPSLYGLFFELSHGANWGSVVAICLSVLLLVWAARRPPSFPFALTFALLVSYHLYLYDTTLLILPLSLLADQFLHREAAPPAALAHSPVPGTSPRMAFNISAFALAALLVSLVVRFIYQIDHEFLIAIPILALLLFQQQWPALNDSPAAADPVPSTAHPCCP